SPLSVYCLFYFGSYCNVDDELHLLGSNSYGRQEKDIQHGATNTLPSNGETLGQGPQLELAGSVVKSDLGGA
ncbi:hypothetical protein Tco_0644280, partial [Tanacetum coccineum]